MEIIERLNPYIWVFGWAIVFYFFSREHTKKSRHTHELIHKERMSAIEKGVSYPELPPYNTEEEHHHGNGSAPNSKRMLAWGAVLLVGGVGVLISLLISENDDLRRNWTLGLIPMFLGVGLWLAYFLLRVVK